MTWDDAWWACEDLNLGPLPYQANRGNLWPSLMCALTWPYRPCASVAVCPRPPWLSLSSSLRSARAAATLTACVQSTPGLSETVAHLGLRRGCIRWDRPVPGSVVVSRGGQRSPASAATF